jgi:hypothetical protein
LLLANSRLHEERVELRAVLDSERERLSEAMAAVSKSRMIDTETMHLRSELLQAQQVRSFG